MSPEPNGASGTNPDEPVRPQRIPREESIGGPPIHPVAALLLIAVDNLWNLADWTILSWVITIPLGFLSVFLPSLIIQRFLKRNTLGQALGYAFLLGSVAAIPSSITGTPVGIALLAWTGINRLLGRSTIDAVRPIKPPR